MGEGGRRSGPEQFPWFLSLFSFYWVTISPFSTLIFKGPKQQRMFLCTKVLYQNVRNFILKHDTSVLTWPSTDSLSGCLAEPSWRFGSPFFGPFLIPAHAGISLSPFKSPLVGNSSCIVLQHLLNPCLVLLNFYTVIKCLTVCISDFPR